MSMKQLSVTAVPAHDEQSLRDYFQSTVDRPVFLTLTRNTVSMLSIRERETGVSIRLHRMFLRAGPEVLDEIRAFIKKRKKPILKVQEFILRNQPCLDARRPRAVSISTRGRNCDLQEIFEALNTEYFSAAVTAAITWGKRSPRRAVRKRRLGSYQRDRDIIRINPVLDSKNVPGYFIEYVVYHEMLHAAERIENCAGRKRVHTKEFKNREKLFKYYEQALAWERSAWRA
jgi:hypothetical protein